MRLKVFCSIIFLLCFLHQYFGQGLDSSDFLSRLKKIALKSKITRAIYNTYLRNNKSTNEINSYSAVDFEKYEGCIIRKINIEVLDPYSAKLSTDSSSSVKGFFQRTVNRFHLSTKSWVISNKLLFKKNQPLYALEISESERALRQTGYINDALISASETENKDSIDVTVVVVDRWSVSIPIQIKSTTNLTVGFKNSNLFGYGQLFEQKNDFDFYGQNIFSGRYFIENIDHTFISSEIFFRHNINETILGFNSQRPSFSPVLKWAGGLDLRKHYYHDKNNFSSDSANFSANSSIYDCWIQRRITKYPRKILKTATGITIGVRTLGKFFHNRPIHYYADDKFLRSHAVLISAGLFFQKYYKENFIYRFGSSEDVPLGFILEITQGFLTKELNSSKQYTSFNFRSARNICLGYLSNTFSLSCFYGKNLTNEVLLNGSIYFFSRKLILKNWIIRQFFQFNYFNDINANLDKKIILRSSDLYSIPTQVTPLKNKSILNIENVFYTPYQVIGFKFAPVLLLGFGAVQKYLSDSKKPLLYYSLALGILLRNENLLNNTFQFSVGFYPLTPEGKKNIFLIGPITSFSIRVNGFSNLKPAFAEY